MLIVSHDRYLIDKVADRLIVFSDNGASVIEGGYKEYERIKSEAETEEIQKENAPKKEKKAYTTPLKEQERQKNAIKKLEKSISDIEQKLVLLDEEISKEEVYTDYVRLCEIEKTRQSLTEELDKLTTEYFTFLEN